MKRINEYILENNSKITLNEAKNTTSIINKIKKEFEQWGDNVHLVSCHHKLYMEYAVYIYDIASIEELRKVDDVLKNNIERYPGVPDDILHKKFNEIKDQVKKHTDAEGVLKYLYDIPCIYSGFTSRDLK